MRCLAVFHDKEMGCCAMRAADGADLHVNVSLGVHSHAFHSTICNLDINDRSQSESELDKQDQSELLVRDQMLEFSCGAHAAT